MHFPAGVRPPSGICRWGAESTATLQCRRREHPDTAALAQRHLALTDALLYADFFHLTHGQRAAHQQQHSISGGASSDSHVQPEVQPQVAPENFSMLQQELIAAHAPARAGAFEETYG